MNYGNRHNLQPFAKVGKSKGGITNDIKMSE